MVAFLEISGGVFWLMAYILIILKGFKDKTYGMPLAALCANISWEFIFSFIFPQVGGQHGPFQLPVNIAWFFLDVVIVFQFVYFGQQTFILRLPKAQFIIVFLITLTIAFFMVLTITLEFDDMLGMYSAFCQNLMMSILFVILLISRKNLSGQSIYIAVFKMLGTLVMDYMIYREFPDSPLLNFLYFAIFFFDALYIGLIYKMGRAEKKTAEKYSIATSMYY